MTPLASYILELAKRAHDRQLSERQFLFDFDQRILASVASPAPEHRRGDHRDPTERQLAVAGGLRRHLSARVTRSATSRAGRFDALLGPRGSAYGVVVVGVCTVVILAPGGS